MMSFSLSSEIPLPDVEQLPVVTEHSDNDSDQPADEQGFHETVGANPNQPMRIGSIWLDGESLMCSCPDCTGSGHHSPLVDGCRLLEL